MSDVLPPSSRRSGTGTPLLEVESLSVHFQGEEGAVRAVENVSFTVNAGEMLGIVGESGSGKSVTSLSVLGLLPPRGRIVSGSVRLDGTELVGMKETSLRQIRGGRVAMIFQDPMTSLNPYLSVGEQLAESAMLHRGLSRRDADRRAVELLERVRIPDAAARLKTYPHELSGGMRQRVMIAMALLGEPELLIADEPTTALDVTIQAEILDLLSELRRERGLSVMLITHDLGIVRSTCDRALVFYAGRIVESAPTTELFARPLHPYTLALLDSLPRLDRRKRPEPIPGMPPQLGSEPLTECSFVPRCRFAHDACRRGEPALVAAETAMGRLRRCVLSEDELMRRSQAPSTAALTSS
jgi:oligopeptide/dipeptide ABC transporter ATP-binding protein